jgi:hypothetical protein
MMVTAAAVALAAVILWLTRPMAYRKNVHDKYWKPSGTYFNAGMDAPYDEQKAAAGVARAKQQTERGTRLPRPRKKPQPAQVVKIDARRVK